MRTYHKRYKISVFGGKDVGKNALVTKYLVSYFDKDLTMTIGVDFFSKSVVINGDKIIKLQFWMLSDDICNRINWRVYIRGSNLTILLYDITNRKSLDNLSEFLKEIKNEIGHEHPILLIGNKIDLEKNRDVTRKQVDDFKNTNNITESIEISLKTRENLREMFKKIIKILENEDIDEIKVDLEPQIPRHTPHIDHPYSIKDKLGFPFPPKRSPHTKRKRKHSKKDVDYLITYIRHLEHKMKLLKAEKHSSKKELKRLEDEIQNVKAEIEKLKPKK